MPSTTEITRKIGARQTRAALVPSSFDAESRTIEVVWSTGARGRRWDWDIGEYDEELSLDPTSVRLDRLNNGASVLNSHRSRDLLDVIGAIVRNSATVDGKEGRAKIVFSTRPDVEPIIEDIRAGVISHISVGYNVHRYELVEGGLKGEIPVYRATDWEPAEISFVPIAFDDGAKTRSKEPEGVTNTCVFVTRGAAAQEGETMPNANEELQRAATNTGAADDQLKAAQRAGIEAERRRQADIRTAVRALPAADREAVERELIDGEVTVEQARATILERLTASQSATQVSNVRVETVEDGREKFVRGATDWLLQKSGLGASVLGDSAKNLQPGEFRGLTLSELARESLERNGISTRGLSKMDMVGRALTLRGGMNTTSDFAVLMENVTNKILLASFATQADTWTRFAATGSVSDFRASGRYRLGSFGTLDKVNEAGEFKNKSIPDATKEMIAAATKGNIIALSRQAIINDDMDAFARLAAMLGRAAKLSVEVDVYALLALNGGLGPVMQDGKTLFHTDHGNIGTASGLTVAGLDADRVQMKNQKDISGNEILDISPAVLLLPASLGGQARILNGAQYDVDVSNKFQVPNRVAGLYRDIVDTARLTGTRRYSFADKDIAPVIEVVFLDGQREPVLESKEGWRVDGVEWKVRYDFGVGAVGYQGAITNAGA